MAHGTDCTPEFSQFSSVPTRTVPPGHTVSVPSDPPVTISPAPEMIAAASLLSRPILPHSSPQRRPSRCLLTPLLSATHRCNSGPHASLGNGVDGAGGGVQLGQQRRVPLEAEPGGVHRRGVRGLHGPGGVPGRASVQGRRHRLRPLRLRQLGGGRRGERRGRSVRRSGWRERRPGREHSSGGCWRRRSGGLSGGCWRRRTERSSGQRRGSDGVQAAGGNLLRERRAGLLPRAQVPEARFSRVHLLGSPVT
jgi:hypothetical protein